MKPRRASWAGFVLLFASLSLAQSPQDALDVLNRVGETYRSVKTLQAEGDIMVGMSSPGMQQNITMHLLLTLAAPGKMRMESITGPVSMLMISDGQTTWLYMPQLNKYSKLESNKTVSDAVNTSIPRGLPGLGIVPDFGKIADGVKEATIVRSETLQLDGISTDCYVIEVLRQSSQQPAGAEPPANAAPAKVEPASETLWVDKARLLVVRLSSDTKVTLPGASAPTETKSTITFNKLTLDNPVPDDAFVFTPPQGATEMDLGQFMPQGATPQ